MQKGKKIIKGSEFNIAIAKTNTKHYVTMARSMNVYPSASAIYVQKGAAVCTNGWVWSLHSVTFLVSYHLNCFVDQSGA